MPEDASEENILKLRNTLNDKNLPLFERYRAMFALRNIGTPPAVDALASGFGDDSALFKRVFPYFYSPFIQVDHRCAGMRLRSCSASFSLPTLSPLSSRYSRILVNPIWSVMKLQRLSAASQRRRSFLTSRSG